MKWKMLEHCTWSICMTFLTIANKTIAQNNNTWVFFGSNRKMATTATTTTATTMTTSNKERAGLHSLNQFDQSLFYLSRHVDGIYSMIVTNTQAHSVR